MESEWTRLSVQEVLEEMRELSQSIDAKERAYRAS